MGLGRWFNGKNTCSKHRDLSLEPQNLQNSWLCVPESTPAGTETNHQTS